MDNQIKIFEGQEVKVKTDKGVKLINLVNTARNCGLTRVQNGYTKIRWTNKGITEKLKLISMSTDVDKKYLDEIIYIIDEIENTDDRNSIYMSSWLSKRLALECHSQKSMRYKNFLVSLDEARENGQIVVANNDVSAVVGQVMNQIIPTLTEQLAQQVVPVMIEAKNQVNNIRELMKDQAVIYDQDRAELRSLIGFRTVNTKRLSNKLKNLLSTKYDISVTASSSYYTKAKKKIFKEFGVNKWEDIPVYEYNKVFAYIEELEGEL